MKKFRIAAIAALVLCWGWAFADVELFNNEDLEIEWDSGTDGFGGSSVETSSDDPLKAVLTLGAEPTDEESDDWPWLYIGTSFTEDVKTMDNFEKIKISYTSNGKFTVGIPTTIRFSGEDVVYQANLASGSNRSVELTLSQFYPPEWMVDEGFDGPANLSLVSKSDIEAGVSFSHENYGTSVEIEVTSVLFYGIELKDEDDDTQISKTRLAKSANFTITGISAGRLGLRVPSAGNYSIAIYGVNGKMLAQTKANLVQGLNTLAISKNLARGVAIVRVQGANASLVKKIFVK